MFRRSGKHALSSAIAEKVDSARDKDNGHQETKTVFVDRSVLEVLNGRQSLAGYAKHLWNTRHFLTAQARTSAFTGGQGTFLGKMWLVLDPIFQVAIYALVFGLILKTHRGIDNFLGFLTLGVVYFRFLTAGLTNGSGLIQRNRNIISSFDFPRAAIPLGTGIRSFYSNSIPAAVAVVLAIAFQKAEGLTWAVLGVVPLYFLIHIWATGATFVTSRITAFVPDAKNLIRVGVQGLFFLSGLFYSVERFEGHLVLSTIMKINPLYQFLNAVRTCVLYGIFPPIGQWAYLVGWSVGLFICGFIYFWRADGAYARVK